jgi:hypothetical protein
MRFRRCAFVPQIDFLSCRIVPGAVAPAPDVAPPPAIAPGSSDDNSSDNVTDPGYGDIAAASTDDSSYGTQLDLSQDSTDDSNNSDGGSTGAPTTDAGSSDDSVDDSESDPDSSAYLSDQEFTVAIPAYSVSAF